MVQCPLTRGGHCTSPVWSRDIHPHSYTSPRFDAGKHLSVNWVLSHASHSLSVLPVRFVQCKFFEVNVHQLERHLSSSWTIWLVPESVPTPGWCPKACQPPIANAHRRQRKSLRDIRHRCRSTRLWRHVKSFQVLPHVRG